MTPKPAILRFLKPHVGILLLLVTAMQVRAQYLPNYLGRNQDFIDRRQSSNGLSMAQNYYDAYLEQQQDRIYSSQKRSNAWTPVGPMGLERLSGMGRVNSVTFHPTDTGCFYICVAQGGVWKTQNSGASWEDISGDLPVLRTSCLAIDPTNPSIMYVALGDFAYLGHNLAANENKRSTHYGLGLYKTTDGGLHWQATGLSFKQTDFEGSLLSYVLINQSNTNSILAVGETGAYYSADAGNTWSKTADGVFWDLEQLTQNPDYVVASTGYVQVYQKGKAAILVSKDFGQTWQQAKVPFSEKHEVQRIELAVSGQGIIYALASDTNAWISDGSGFYGLYISRNMGATFSTLLKYAPGNPNLLNGDFSSSPGGQATYDLALCADQKDSNKVSIGGVNIWTSTTNTSTYLPASYWYLNYENESLHADVHQIKQHPITGRYYACHDGGISSTMNFAGNTINDISQGICDTKWQHYRVNLNITSFYRVALHPETAKNLLAGAQDNSTVYTNDTTWVNVSGGDGMDCSFSGNYEIYTSSQYGNIYNYYILDNNFRFSGTFGSPSDELAEWTTPFTVVNRNFYIGYGNVYSDFFAKTKLSNFPLGNLDYPLPITALYVNPADEKIIYACKRGFSSLNINGEVWRTTDRGKKWTDISTNLPVQYYPSDIEAINDTATTLFISFSNFEQGKKVYQSRDGGNTWVNISYNLPNIPVNCLAYQNDKNGNLYVGTDLGVYFLDPSKKEWEFFSDDLPRVIVSDLKISLNDFKIVAATFGRGIWQADLKGIPIGQQEILQAKCELSVSPNPASKSFQIQCISQTASLKGNLEIIDLTGKTIGSYPNFKTNTFKEIDCSNWHIGTYYIVFSNANTRIVQTFLKK